MTRLCSDFEPETRRRHEGDTKPSRRLRVTLEKRYCKASRTLPSVYVSSWGTKLFYCRFKTRRRHEHICQTPSWAFEEVGL